jgi:hypothetical protein
MTFEVLVAGEPPQPANHLARRDETDGQLNLSKMKKFVRRRWAPVSWVLVVGITLLLQLPIMALHVDIRFTFGVLRATREADLSSIGVFVHRPMLNRVMMDALHETGFGSVVTFERSVLVVAILLTGVVCAALGLALSRWVSRLCAMLTGMAVFVALAWAPDPNVLQPEWTATCLAVAALALALWRKVGAERFASPYLACAGFLLAAAALQKYSTITTAALAFGIVLVLDRRRAWILMAWSTAATACLFILTMLVEPHEWQWFVEMPRINVSGHLRWNLLERSLVNTAWISPQVLLLPAAVVLAYVASRRRAWVVGTAVAAVVVMSTIVFQNSFYIYHYCAWTVLAAGLVTVASVQWWKRTSSAPWCMVVVAPLWLVTASVVQVWPFAWRTVHTWLGAVLVLLAMAVAILLAALQVRFRGQPSNSVPKNYWACGGMLLALALVVTFGGWPHTPYGYNYMDVSRISALNARRAWIAEGNAIRRATKNAHVVYLGSANLVYFAGRPTNCRYPVSMFLIRSSLVDASHLASFKEGIACLHDPQAKYLITESNLMRKGAMHPSVKKTAYKYFNCAKPVAKTPTTITCRRR